MCLGKRFYVACGGGIRNFDKRSHFADAFGVMQPRIHCIGTCVVSGKHGLPHAVALIKVGEICGTALQIFLRLVKPSRILGTLAKELGLDHGKGIGC